MPNESDLHSFTDACDCHVHIFGDKQRYPMNPNRIFTPGKASTTALRQHMDTISVSRVIIVQPSVYGTDNSCTADAIQELGSDARGICVVDDSCSAPTLRALNQAGFRGVRLNLHTTENNDSQLFTLQITSLQEPLTDLGWHIQTYCDAGMLSAVVPLMKNAAVPLVLDHFGGVGSMHAESAKPLMALLDTGNVYLKLSAPERVTDKTSTSKLAEWVATLTRNYPSRLLWGSDWPHPGNLGRGPRKKDEIEPFRSVDNRAALRRLLEWLDDDGTAQLILVKNPETLYGF